MSPVQKETYDKIKKWILETKNLSLRDVGETKFNAFTLLINTKDSKRISINIIGSKTNNKKILLSWAWGLPKHHTKTIKKAILTKAKMKCELDLRIGLGDMGLSVDFYPSMDELEVISTEKFIYLNRLTKTRLYGDITLLLKAYVFTARKLVQHFKIPKPSNIFSKFE